MRRKTGALLTTAALFWAAVSFAKGFPPSPRSYIHNEGIITGGTADHLSRRLSGLEQKTGHQFVVALFNSLDGDNLEKYSNLLYKEWKIGGKKGNDGLLFVVFKNDRKWRVEIGYGMEGTITDLEAAEIARDFAVPKFKAGDYDGGVRDAVEELARKVEGLPRSKPKEESGGGSQGWFIFLLLLFWNYPQLLWVVIFVIMILADRGSRSRSTLSGKGSKRSRGFFSGGSGWSSGGGGGGWSSGGGGGGGFSGGGGSSGGGGASGGW